MADILAAAATNSLMIKEGLMDFAGDNIDG